MNLKCSYCGASLNINDEKCPNCGKTNKQTKKHISDMKKYQKQSESTQKTVHKETFKSVELLSRGIILLVLIIILIVMSISLAITSSKDENKMVNEAFKNNEEVTNTMLSYWNNGEYYRFSAYCDYYDITSRTDAPAKPFLQYRPLMKSAEIYGFINDHIISYCLTKGSHKKIKQISTVCSLLNEFYNDKYIGNKFDDKNVEETNTKYLSMIRNDMSNILKSYFYLSDEDIQQFPNMTDEQMLITIEERLEQHNEKK